MLSLRCKPLGVDLCERAPYQHRSDSLGPHDGSLDGGATRSLGPEASRWQHHYRDEDDWTDAHVLLHRFGEMQSRVAAAKYAVTRADVQRAACRISGA